MPIRWDETERFARSVAEDAARVDGVATPRFLAYDHRGAIAVLTLEDPVPPAEEVVATCVELFAPLHPLRFAAMYPLVVDLADPPCDSRSDHVGCRGVWIVRGDAVPPGAPRWTATLLGYRLLGGRVAWADGRVDRPVVPGDGVRATGLAPILAGSDPRTPGTSQVAERHPTR